MGNYTFISTHVTQASVVSNVNQVMNYYQDLAYYKNFLNHLENV